MANNVNYVQPILIMLSINFMQAQRLKFQKYLKRQKGGVFGTGWNFFSIKKGVLKNLSKSHFDKVVSPFTKVCTKCYIDVAN